MASRIPIWAVLPVKGFDGAKQRLAPAFPQSFRRTLMMTMVEDVLDALSQSKRLAGRIVVTDDPDAAALAEKWGARVVGRGAQGGHTGAVKGGASVIAEEALGGLFALPGDAPGVTAQEIDALIARHGEAPAFTIAPSHDRRGSNGIVATPPDVVALAYGDDSFLPHLARARAGGVEPAIVELEGLSLDVDHPEDLDMLAARNWKTRTHAFLAAHPLFAVRRLAKAL